MPYPSEHACRLIDPGQFSEFRRKDEDGASVIMGKRKDSGAWEVQAIRYDKSKWTPERAAASCKSHKGRFDAASGVAKASDEGLRPWDVEVDGDMPAEAVAIFSELSEETKSYARKLTGVEIFQTGTWNGDSYTEADLDAMVSAFHSLPIQPPVKLGHSEAQKFFGQADGAPALGWVARLRRYGNKLVGDIEDLPAQVDGLIREKKYRKLSAEIYWNFKDGEGKTWPRVLKAVALLGADLPAVTNLQDLQAALMASGKPARQYDAGKDESITVKSYEENEEGRNEMNEKEYQDKIAALQTQVNDEKEKRVAAEERASKIELEAGLRTFTLELESLVKDGKVLPAWVKGLQDDFLAMGIAPRKYGEKEMPWGEKKLAELKAGPRLVEFKEMAKGGAEGKDDVKTFSSECARVQAEKKCSYAEAMQFVRDQEPKLWENYVLGKEGK